MKIIEDEIAKDKVMIYKEVSSPNRMQVEEFVGHYLGIPALKSLKVQDVLSMSYFTNKNNGYHAIGIRVRKYIKTGMGFETRNFVKKENEKYFIETE